MKPYLYTLLAAAAATGFVQAQTAYTTPVGYTTQALPANTFSLVGLNVQSPTLVAGLVESVSGADVTDTGAFAGLTPGKLYILEITDGTAAGTTQEFTTWNNDTITLPSTVAGIAAGDSYAVREAATLQNTFSVGAGLIVGGIGATNADKIWVPTGSGTYTKYWYKTNAPVGWRITTTGTNDAGAVAGDVPLPYIDGVLVEKKTSAGAVTITGEVKTTGSNYLIVPGFNLLTVVPPVGSTLFTAGLDGDIAGGLGATNADIVWIPTGTGTYTKYWYKTNAPIGWRITTTGTNDAGAATDVNLTPGILIQRKGATSKVISMTVPASYSNL